MDWIGMEYRHQMDNQEIELIDIRFCRVELYHHKSAKVHRATIQCQIKFALSTKSMGFAISLVLHHCHWVISCKNWIDAILLANEYFYYISIGASRKTLASKQ